MLIINHNILRINTILPLKHEFSKVMRFSSIFPENSHKHWFVMNMNQCDAIRLSTNKSFFLYGIVMGGVLKNLDIIVKIEIIDSKTGMIYDSLTRQLTESPENSILIENHPVFINESKSYDIIVSYKYNEALKLFRLLYCGDPKSSLKPNLNEISFKIQRLDLSNIRPYSIEYGINEAGGPILGFLIAS